MKLTILIIDADADIARITAAGLTREFDATTVIETDAEQAWLRIQQHPPHVVVIDPVPTSPSSRLLIQAIRVYYPAICIIVLASAATPTLRQTMQQLGVDVYLEKPLLLTSALAQITRTLEQYGYLDSHALVAEQQGDQHVYV